MANETRRFLSLCIEPSEIDIPILITVPILITIQIGVLFHPVSLEWKYNNRWRHEYHVSTINVLKSK